MRWFNTAVIVILASAIVLFAIQNFKSVTVSFLTMNLSMPLAVLIVIVYVLGMLTGGSMWALIRWAIDDVKRSRSA